MPGCGRFVCVSVACVAHACRPQLSHRSSTHPAPHLAPSHPPRSKGWDEGASRLALRSRCHHRLCCACAAAAGHLPACRRTAASAAAVPRATCGCSASQQVALPNLLHSTRLPHVHRRDGNEDWREGHSYLPARLRLRSVSVVADRRRAGQGRARVPAMAEAAAQLGASMPCACPPPSCVVSAGAERPAPSLPTRRCTSMQVGCGGAVLCTGWATRQPPALEAAFFPTLLNAPPTGA